MDINGIGEVLGLASSAVGLTGKATTTVEAIKKLLTADNQTDNGETAQLLNTLASELTAANMMNVQISESLRDLSQKLRRQDEFVAEKARYELIKTRKGDMAFALKKESANGQPPHFICPVCLNQDKLISYLRGDYTMICQANNSHYVDFHDAPPFRAEGY